MQIPADSEEVVVSLSGIAPDSPYFQEIVEHMPVYIATADVNGYVTYLNKTARQWAGLDGDDQPEGGGCRGTCWPSWKKPRNEAFGEASAC